MSLATSEVSFEARATAIGLQSDVVERLKKAGYACLSDFAYSTAYISGQTDDSLCRPCPRTCPRSGG